MPARLMTTPHVDVVRRRRIRAHVCVCVATHVCARCDMGPLGVMISVESWGARRAMFRCVAPTSGCPDGALQWSVDIALSLGGGGVARIGCTLGVCSMCAGCDEYCRECGVGARRNAHGRTYIYVGRRGCPPRPAAAAGPLRLVSFI